MSIAEKLTKINSIKEDIKAALEYKGLTVTDQFDTYADQIKTLGVADGEYADPFASIGYGKEEQMPWLNIQLADSQAVIDSWNPEVTRLTGTNIMFYPVVDTSNVTNMSSAFKNMTTLRSVGLLYTGKVTDMSYMFQGCTNLITIPEFNTPKVTNLAYMFEGCTKLQNIPNIITDNVTSTAYMFNGCTSLNQIPLINTEQVTNMNYMFNGCTSLKYAPLHAYNTSKVTDMTYMFNGCTALEELSFVGCDLSKVTNWSNITTNCTALAKADFTNAKIGNGFRFSYFASADEIIYNGLDTSAMTDTSYLFTVSNGNNVDISSFDLSNVTDMSYTFNANKSNSIILGNVDTSNVTNMSYMFQSCTNLTDLDLSGIDVSKVTTMAYLFDGCTKLVNLNFAGWNTDSLTNMNYMFQNCSVLDTLDLSMFDTSKVTNMSQLFYGCKTNSLILDGWDFSAVSSQGNWLTSQSSKNVSLKNVKAKGSFICPYASESIDLSGINTTACTQFKLNGCDASTIDLSSVNTANFTSMYEMFSGCGNVTSLNISHFDYSKVANMSNMFYNCVKLSGTFTIGGNNKVTNMQYMFYGCKSLTNIDLTNLQLDLVTNMQYMFQNCSNLTEIRMGGNPAKITNANYVVNMFSGVASEGVFYYNSEYDYSKIINVLPSGWEATPLINVTECTSLTIEAEDVTSDKTSTTIRYTAIVNGTNPISGAEMTGIELTGKAQSSEFSQNTTTSDKTLTISYTYLGVTATTTITQYKKPSYELNLNNQWRSSSIANPDPTLYDGVYESFSNFNANNASADCIITIDGYTNFDIYVRSNAESTYDYVQVFELDNTSKVKTSTSGKQNAGTTIGSYTKVSFTNIDRGVHTILVRYKKDASGNSGDDRGYLLIPKN